MKKILVVDDEAELRNAIALALSVEGYETIEAENGIQAYDLTKRKKPDIIISDVIMDNLNGFLFHELLKDEDVASKILWILMSGHAIHAGAWKSDPMVVYIEKPFSIPSLLKAIELAEIMSEERTRAQGLHQLVQEIAS
jgi:DNA-binding NtrC family response regulator